MDKYFKCKLGNESGCKQDANKSLLIYTININVGKFLLLISGDIEQNPGPQSQNHNLSILHLNVRSIRNKLEYIQDNCYDFDVLCFTETHLDNIFPNKSLHLDTHPNLYRNDISSHSGGILIYTTSKILTNRLPEFEVLIPDSIWIKVKNNCHDFILCVVYRRPNSNVKFWENLSTGIERANEMCKNFLLLGDINEDQLNPSNHKLKDILILNNLSNKINEPTRVTEYSSTLLDPVVKLGRKLLNLSNTNHYNRIESITIVLYKCWCSTRLYIRTSIFSSVR